MDKSPDAFRTISEVAEWLGVQAHVLRFWESKFTQVKPVKRAGGRRYYRPSDMRLIGGIKKLLHDDGLTIKGVQKILREHGVAHVSEMSQPLEAGAADDVIEMPKVVPFETSKARKAQRKQTEMRLDLGPEPEEIPAEAEEAPTDADAETAAVETEAEPAGGDAPPVESAPALPSFLKRPAAETGAETGAEPGPPKPRIVEAPDPPRDESTLPYAPGLLALLSHTHSLSPALAAEIAPLARELQDWVDRSTRAGAR